MGFGIKQEKLPRHESINYQNVIDFEDIVFRAISHLLSCHLNNATRRRRMDEQNEISTLP